MLPEVNWTIARSSSPASTLCVAAPGVAHGTASPGGNAYLGDELAGPLDARFGLKLALVERPQLAITAIGSVFLPFGDDEMLLGDRNLVFEPRLALDWRRDRVHATGLVANLGARIRERTVLQAYDAMNMSATPADARALLDVGSELVAGLGGAYELTPRAVAAIEAQVFVPLPDGLSWGDCRLYSGARCSTLGASDYASGAHHGDFTTQLTAGVSLRVTSDVYPWTSQPSSISTMSPSRSVFGFMDPCGSAEEAPINTMASPRKPIFA